MGLMKPLRPSSAAWSSAAWSSAGGSSAVKEACGRCGAATLLGHVLGGVRA